MHETMYGMDFWHTDEGVLYRQYRAFPNRDAGVDPRDAHEDAFTRNGF